MAQFNSAEEIILPEEYTNKVQMNTNEYADRIEVGDVIIESTDVMTGDRNEKQFLYYQLKMSMIKAERIDIIVSFLMESGVRMILKDLRSVS